MTVAITTRSWSVLLAAELETASEIPIKKSRYDPTAVNMPGRIASLGRSIFQGSRIFAPNVNPDNPADRIGSTQNSNVVCTVPSGLVNKFPKMARKKMIGTQAAAENQKAVIMRNLNAIDLSQIARVGRFSPYDVIVFDKYSPQRLHFPLTSK